MWPRVFIFGKRNLCPERNVAPESPPVENDYSGPSFLLKPHAAQGEVQLCASRRVHTVSAPGGSFPRQPWGVSQLIYRPALSLASDCRRLFFFFFYERAEARTCRDCVVDCSRCRRALPLPPLVLPHTVCIVLPGTLQGLACGGGIQGVRRLHLRTLSWPISCSLMVEFRLRAILVALNS